MRSRRLLGLLIAAPAAAVLLFMVMMGALFFGASTTSVAASCAASGVGGPARVPLVGRYTVTSEFGMRWGRLHDGIDLSAGGGAQVVAAAGGTIWDVGSDGPTSGRGNFIYVDVGGGVIHGYFHLAAVPTLTAGSTVATGAVLGIEGNTGHSTGAHLHFQVHINGTPTNPREWFTSAGVEVPPLGGSGVGPPAGAGGSPTPSGSPSSPTSGGGNVPPPGFPTSIAGYTTEQLINAAWIIKAGQSMHLDAWTLTVGVMTAMGESSLRVLDYGDDAGPDSRGLFQQRDSWGPLEVRMDPTGSSLLFFKALLKVPNYHSLEPTIAAHRTQINADPYHYAPFWDPAVTVTDYFLQHQDLLDAMPDTSSGVSAGTSCKPFLSGLITRQDLSKSSIPRGDELAGFVVEPDWADLEPVEGQFAFEQVAAALDYATAHGQRVRLRVMPDPPPWAKNIGGTGGVPFHDHDTDRDITIGRFWLPEYQAKWQQMITALAAAFDAHPALAEVNISGVSAISAEDMLLQLNDATTDGVSNRQHLLAAGFTDTARDTAYIANVGFFQSVWKATNTTLWVHPYTTLTGSSLEKSKELATRFRAQSGRTSFGHTGADQATIEGKTNVFQLYEWLRDGGPFTLQTRSLNGGFDGGHPVGDLSVIVAWCMTNKVMAVELPRGDWQSQLSPELVAAANAAMNTNAASYALAA